MADDKDPTSVPLSQGVREEEEGRDPEDPLKSPRSSPDSSTRRACCFVLQSWVSKKFMTGCVVLFPVAVTFFVTWWFIQFVDGFFSPLYTQLGIDIFETDKNALLKFEEITSGQPPVIFDSAC
ncbi:Protein LIKE COV 2 [Orobanche gracilis]